jgi:hypothetical protein
MYFFFNWPIKSHQIGTNVNNLVPDISYVCKVSNNSFKDYMFLKDQPLWFILCSCISLKRQLCRFYSFIKACCMEKHKIEVTRIIDEENFIIILWILFLVVKKLVCRVSSSYHCSVNLLCASYMFDKHIQLIMFIKQTYFYWPFYPQKPGVFFGPVGIIWLDGTYNELNNIVHI